MAYALSANLLDVFVYLDVRIANCGSDHTQLVDVCVGQMVDFTDVYTGDDFSHIGIHKNVQEVGG